MGRVSTIQTNFTAGEMSPRLLGRVDIARYPNSVKRMENFFPLVHGGARRRWGSRFLAEVKDSTKLARLLPFIFNRDQTFLLEMGAEYTRFYTPDGQVLSSGLPYEISTTYLDTDLADLHYAQSADTMLLTHPDWPINSLVRYANTNWKIGEKVLLVPANDEKGDKPNTTLTLSDATVGTGRTATAGAATFLASFVGRQITVGAGLATITGYTSSTVVTVRIDSAFSGVGPFAALGWTLTESPKTGLTPSVKEPVGGAVTLTADADAFSNSAQITDIGKFVEINEGLVEITAYTSPTVVTGIIRSLLTATGKAASGGWALRSEIWNEVDGYPRAICLDKQRMFLGGSDAYPNRIDASKTGELFNFADGAEDTDGFAYAIGGEYNAIEHFGTMSGVIPLTFGMAWKLSGGVEKAITPTNPQLDDQAAFGASRVRPIRIGDYLFYIQRGGKRVRALGYNLNMDKLSARDVMIFSEHITKPGIVDMAYAQEPDPILLKVRSDGVLVVTAIDMDQEVVGPSRQITDGRYESVAVIPNGDVDQIGVIVRRRVNGVWKRYIEVFEEGLQTDSAVTGSVPSKDIEEISWAAGTATVKITGHGYANGAEVKVKENDATGYNGRFLITVTDANHFTYPLEEDPGEALELGVVLYGKTKTWSGFGHLEGKTLDVLGDSEVMPQATVTSGAIELSEEAFEIEAGLHYESNLELLPPALSSPEGTAQGAAMSTHECTVRLHETIGGKINGKSLDYRKFGGTVLNQAVQPFTGDIALSQIGWSKGNETITITQDQPLPMQVLAAIRKMTINS